MTPVLSLLSLALLQTVKLAINRGNDVRFLVFDAVIMQIMQQIIKAVLALDRRERQAFAAPFDLYKALLVLEQDAIQAGMKLLDLDLSQALPLLHGIFQTLTNNLILHVKKLCHGLPSPVEVPLVLGLSGALLLLVRRIPLPLRLPLRLPRRVRLAWTVIRLGPEVAVWVARPPDHAIAQLPFCNIDLKPAMRPEMCVTLAGSIEPGEQVLGSGPEGAEEFEAGESVHRLRLFLCGLACLAQP
jgi:hypothetical protein